MRPFIGDDIRTYDLFSTLLRRHNRNSIRGFELLKLLRNGELALDFSNDSVSIPPERGSNGAQSELEAHSSESISEKDICLQREALLFSGDFGSGGNMEPRKRSGWSAAESGFTWTIGPESCIELPIPGDAGPVALELTVRPFVRASILPAQTLRVSVNDVLLGACEVSERQTLSWIFTPRVTPDRASLAVTFHHPEAAKPSQVIGSKDDRPLAFAFEAVKLYKLAKSDQLPTATKMEESLTSAPIRS